MAQEFFINSQTLEDKVRNLLPSQGGAGAGFDLSASTQIIPIIDLTESAEGSNLRVDLQTAKDFAVTRTSITNATNTVAITTTGFFQVTLSIVRDTSGANNTEVNLFDGTTSKPIFSTNSRQGGTGTTVTVVNMVVFLRAGDSLRMTAGAFAQLELFSRQIASIDGTITNPLGF